MTPERPDARQSTPPVGDFGAPSLVSDADPAIRAAELEARYEALVAQLPGVVYVDGVGDRDLMLDIGPGIEELLGISRKEWLSNYLLWESTIHPDDHDRVVAESERCVQSGDPFRVDYRALHRDGRVVWIHEEATLVRDQNGGPLYWLGFMHDVTDRMRAASQLADTRARYGALVEQIPAIVYVDVVDEDMSTTYVSPQIESILGVTPHEYCEDPDLWAKHLHPDDRDDALHTYLAGREAGGAFTFEYRLIARDGRVVWFRDSAVVIQDESGRPQYVHGVMLDITERKSAEEQVAFLAYHDKVTELPNRALFEELLDVALARGRRHNLGVAVISVDVDNFKLVNDSLGHDAGNELLRQLSERLGEATRETDLVARPGGDEFLLLLSDLDTTPPVPGGTDGALLVAQSVAGRIQHALRSPFEVAGTELYVTASLGVSVFPQDAQDGPQLVQHADEAMFLSKRSGPGGFLVHTPRDDDARGKLALTTRLRKAVESRSWTLHYQPVVELEHATMVGVEALIRWQDPNGGLLPPGEFIPLAEEMGLIEAIGDWVVEELARQDAAWRAEGLSTNISFNLSPRQLWQPDLVAKIVSSLIAAGMDPTRVIVEILESAAMTDPDRTQQIFLDLHDRGLKLAIDDFGIGYSSLARLKHMPVDVLKIDRSFIRGVDADRDSQSMVTAMIGLADNLGMTPVAEGIETEGEWRFLTGRGCRFGQGFFFARPAPGQDVLASWRRSSLRIVEGDAS